MGIFTRIGALMKANINDLIDRAEDPERMVKQIILEAMAAERMAKKQMDDAIAKSNGYENKAKAALQAGNAEMAKKALASKVKADSDVASFTEMHDTISSQTEAIRDQVEVLKSKLEEAKARQNMLIARSQMADTSKNLSKTLGGVDVKSSSAKFDRMEDKVVRKEAEAQAFRDINSTTTADDDEFERIESDIKVDAELSRLMAEMGMAPTPAPAVAPAASPTPDVAETAAITE